MILKPKWCILVALAIVAVFFNAGHINAAANAPDVADIAEAQLGPANEKLPVYFFWGDGCPHCHDEILFLQKIKSDYPEIQWLAFETWNNRKNYNLLLKMSKEAAGKSSTAVPLTIVGDEYVLGYNNDNTTGIKIKQLLEIYISKSKPGSDEAATKIAVEEKISYPLLGQINLNSLSLPILTVVLGTLDGFNPCSMWALIVLITLLINSGSKKKMWIVGGVFILVSAISYFLFLTAWLNAFLKFGYLNAVKISIGVLAVAVGLYFLIDFYKKRKQDALTCDAASSKTKNKIITKLENALKKESLLAMLLGVAVVAFSVNLIEFVCSAGIPAIYTKILTENEVSSAGYYIYLLIYDFFYMLDDIAVLVIAGFTWQLFLSSGKYTKYSHLIGGVLLLILGLIMLFNPNLLMF